MQKFLKKILQADDWAHHHTAMILAGVFLSGFMAFWQLLMPQIATHAAGFDCVAASNIAVPVSECQALVDLYASTNGPSWSTNNNWNTDTNICLRDGIGCTPGDLSGYAHVQYMNLPNNNMNGSVPQTIGNLSYLTNIELSQNPNLSFNIETVQGLTGLQYLGASRTQLAGDFDTLSGLVNMQSLNLGCRDTNIVCYVHGNLNTVINMNNLANLAMENLGIYGTLDVLYDKQNLAFIDLDRNHLSGSIDTAIGNMTGLVNIQMFGNDFTGPLPSSLSNLTNLTTLDISHNHLDGEIPSSFSSFTQMQFFNLLDNEFTGNFAVDISAWSGLQDFRLGSNTGLSVNMDIFAGLGSSVQTINLDDTQVDGSLSNLHGLVGLINLSISCLNTQGLCSLDGSLADLSGASGLQNLSISFVNLAGTLDGLYDLTGLIYLDLNSNALTGTLGAGIANWTSLLNLNLQNNYFNGSVPNELGQLTQLVSLNLGENSFGGPLPELVGFYQLDTIYLGDNAWTGELPTSWGDLTTLKTINVGGRGLSTSFLEGTLPESWGNLVNLERLDILFTNIGGSLPESWGNLTHLAWFTLFYNDFTGPIPDSYSGFLLNNTQGRFWLNNNHFDGPIPEWFSQISYDGKIEANCFDIDNVSNDLQSNLDAHFNTWDTQSNCIPDVRISTRVTQSGAITPGSLIDYYIDYNNIGAQKASNLIISQDFADGLTIDTDYSNGADGLITADYFVSGDSCYSDMMYDGQGPYADYMASVLGGYTNMPSTGDLNAVADRVFRPGGDFDGFTLQNMRDLIGDQQLGSGGMVTTFFCAFVAGILNDGNPDQSAMQSFYNDLGAQCFVPLFGIDPRDIADETCGANKIFGYNWDIGTLPAGGSGTIHIKLKIPDNATVGTTFSNESYIQVDGENQNPDGNEQSFNFIVNNLPTPHNSAGGGGGSSTLNTDTNAGVCSLRDCSDSYYDGVCGVCPATTGNQNKLSGNVVSDPLSLIPDAQTITSAMHDAQGTTEQIKAFLFAKAAGLTSISDFAQVRAFDGITRAEFSKVLVGFLENVLGRKADASRLRICSQYSDVSKNFGDLQLTIYKACMHKVMGLKNDGMTPLESFNPNEVMTRKYIVTTLSRVIWGNKNDNGDPFYVHHMQAMLDAGLVSNPDPEMVEQRINTFTIMMRMAEQFDSLFAK